VGMGASARGLANDPVSGCPLDARVGMEERLPEISRLDLTNQPYWLQGGSYSACLDNI